MAAATPHDAGAACSRHLLQPPSCHVAEAYYKVLLPQSGISGLEVRLDAGSGRGKGVFTTRPFSEGDALFSERPLVACQHLSNKSEVQACSNCFKFLGSIEHQVAHNLLNVVHRMEQQAAAGSGSKAASGGEQGDDDGNDDEDEDDVEELQQRIALLYEHTDVDRLQRLASGEEKLPLSDQFPLPKPVPCRLGCGEQYCSADCEAAAWAKHHCLLCCGPQQKEPAQAPAAQAAPVDRKGKGKASAPAPDQNQQQHSGATPEVVHGVSVDREALKAFNRHASSTNDIFLLAAQVMATTLVRACTIISGAACSTASTTMGCASSTAHGCQSHADKCADQAGAVSWTAACTAAAAASAAAEAADRRSIWDEGPSSIGTAASAAAAAPSSSSAVPAAPAAEPSSCAGGSNSSSASDDAAGPDLGALQPVWRALQQAWLPFALGWKRVWWDSVAAPDDVEDEAAFRSQLRDLADESLALLRKAWGADVTSPSAAPAAAAAGGSGGSSAAVGSTTPSAAFLLGALLSLQPWGAVVGMFELNNLGLVVPSPVEDYFLAVDGLPEGGDKAEVTAVTQPLLDALDKHYDTGAEGTAFLALQSCANHSCAPTAVVEADADGSARLLALRDIPAGCEVSISYIEEADLSYKERQAALRDYGFTCTCERCLKDKKPKQKALLPSKGRAGGVKHARR